MKTAILLAALPLLAFQCDADIPHEEEYEQKEEEMKEENELQPKREIKFSAAGWGCLDEFPTEQADDSILTASVWRPTHHNSTFVPQGYGSIYIARGYEACKLANEIYQGLTDSDVVTIHCYRLGEKNQSLDMSECEVKWEWIPADGYKVTKYGKVSLTITQLMEGEIDYTDVSDGVLSTDFINYAKEHNIKMTLP
jgi:hypothetical protein